MSPSRFGSGRRVQVNQSGGDIVRKIAHARVPHTAWSRYTPHLSRARPGLDE